MIDLNNDPRFPRLSEDVLKTLLTPPTPGGGVPRVVVDTDLANEVDDYFAVSWLLLAHRAGTVNVEALYAAPWSFRTRLLELLQAQEIETAVPREERTPEEQALVAAYSVQIADIEARGCDPRDFLTPPEGAPGKYDHVSVGPDVGMRRSFTDLKALAKRLWFDGKVLAGADGYLPDGCPRRSEAVTHLIDTARTCSTQSPLYVLGLACATDLASALLIAPDIRDRVVFVWTAGYPTNVTSLRNTSFNLQQDLPAAQVLFSSGCALVYLAGFYIGQQLTLSRPDVKEWFEGQGEIGDLLFRRYMHNPLFKWYGIDRNDLTGRVWNIWDLFCVAWMLNPSSVPTELVHAPTLTDDEFWQPNRDGSLIRDAIGIAYNSIFPPFVKMLQK